jgi:hypothetical protein
MSLKTIITAAAATLLLTACSNDDAPDVAAFQRVPLVINASVVEAGTRAEVSAFQAGDQIGVYVGSSLDVPFEVNPAEGGGICFSTTDGKTFTSSKLLYFDSEEVPIKAYYPYHEAYEWSLGSTNQYARPDDILYAEGTVHVATGKVDLVFYHQLSKLTFNVTWGEKYGGGQKGKDIDLIGLKVNGLITTGVFTAPNTIIADGNMGTLNIAYPDMTSTYMVIPQDVTSFELVTQCLLLIDPYPIVKNSTTVPVPSGKLESGKNYIYNVTIE